MSYRSNVAVTVFESDLKNYLLNNPDDEFVETAKANRYGDKAIILKWDNIQWNEDKAYKFRYWLSSVPNWFLRIGEDYGDIEYNADDNLEDFKGSIAPIASIVWETGIRFNIAAVKEKLLADK